MGANVSYTGDTGERSQYSSLDPYDHLKTVSKINYDKLEGTWWIMAHAPVEDEDNCDRSTRVISYDSNKDIIKMKKQCWKLEELSSESDHIIVFPYPDDLGKGKVTSIKDRKENMLWFHEIDYDNYAIVGDPKNHILWIWTRQEKVERDLVPFFQEKSAEYGYDPENLILDSGDIID